MNEEVKVCKICGKEKPIGEFHKDGIRKHKQQYKNKCNVCSAKIIKNLEYNDVFTEDVVTIILDSILNEKVFTINELSLLINIELNSLLTFVKLLNIKSKPIKIEFTCKTCGKESSRIASQLEKHENNYCSKECHDIDQSKEIEMTCKWCGDTFNKTPLKGQENYFCCHDCSVKFLSIERTKDLVINICENCGQEYEIKEYDAKDRRFCSKKCVGEYFTGENNARFVQKLKVKCDWCGTEFEDLESSYNLSVKHFCGRDCQHEYHAKVFSQTDEWKEFMRLQAVNNLANGVFTHTNTNPQLIVNGLLEDLSIEYENEYNCKHYSIDNYLKESNLFIEVMGTFWHTDNRKYKQINYLSQAEGISRDKGKNTFIKKYYNINTLYLWEYDIETNPELCKELILSYVNNKGLLYNYHSFNYNLDKNLKINKDLIIPYMEYDIKDLNEIIDLSIRELRSRYDPDKHIIFNCEQCGEESSSFIDQYNSSDHHFCSRKCNSTFYGKERSKINKICEVCGNNLQVKNDICKVCTFKSKHTIEYSEKWTEEVLDIILNNVLYKRIEYLNELEVILNIPLKEILIYMKLIGVSTTLKVKRKCLQCGEEYTLIPSRIISGKDKFCSKECSSLHQKRDRIKLNCECCNEEIERTQSQYDKSQNHFCSTECAEIWKKEHFISTNVLKICEICNAEYSVNLSRAESSVVCSVECQGKWQSKHLVGINANGFKSKELIQV